MRYGFIDLRCAAEAIAHPVKSVFARSSRALVISGQGLGLVQPYSSYRLCEAAPRIMVKDASLLEVCATMVLTM